MIQAVASPTSTRIIKYVDARIVIILGLSMLAGSFFMNNNFTLQTDHSYILSSLILRGVGMGILFPPLLSVSLEQITPAQMAQASSISNITRQLGGSVGVCYFTYMLTIRRNFHTQIYSEEIDYTGATYQRITSRLADFFSAVGSDTATSSAEQAKNYLTQWLHTEAYINGINDNFLIGGIVTVLAIIPVFFIITKKKKTINN